MRRPGLRHALAMNQIGEVFVGEADEAMVRVVFSSYADQTQTACLYLKHDWKRLALSLSLTEEVCGVCMQCINVYIILRFFFFCLGTVDRGD